MIANSFQGRRLNRPNDVVVKSDGSIYFTDPWLSPVPPGQWDLTFSGVYRVAPDLGTITLLVDDFVFPKGLAFSRTKASYTSTIFRRGHIRAFDVAAERHAGAPGFEPRQSDALIRSRKPSTPLADLHSVLVVQRKLTNLDDAKLEPRGHRRRSAFGSGKTRQLAEFGSLCLVSYPL